MGKRMQNARDMEAKIAELLDGKQSFGPSSKPGEPDVVTDQLIVECKHRKKLPKWLKGAVNQASDYTTQESLGYPVAVLHEKHSNHAEDFVVTPIWAFKKLLEG
ncbi:MAG: hypothetical protein ABEJ72_03170 [Candidatus Aenigmatarchaeota archaeon]